MKKIKHRHIYLIALLIVMTLGYRALGGFSFLSIQEEVVGPYTIVYMPFSGGFVKYYPHIGFMEKKLIQDGIISSTSKVYVYHDVFDEKDSSEKHEGEAGIVIGQEMKNIDKSLSTYKVMTIPAGKKFVVEFPYKGLLSCMLGHMRGMKMLHDFLKMHGDKDVSIIEFYDEENHVIKYIAEEKR